MTFPSPSSSSLNLPSNKEPSTKFKEHLSIYIPPPDFPVVVSRFSPESPPASSRVQSTSTWTNTTTMRSSTVRDVEANPVVAPRSASSKFRDRFTKLAFDFRTMVRDKDPELVPIQPPLQPWPPLHVEKRGCCHDCPCHQKAQKKTKRSRRDKILIAVLIIVILYLLGDTLFLNIRVLSNQTTYIDSPLNTTAATSTTLSANAQQCLSQYTVNAPSNPSGYPCSSCLPVLQAVPSNFSDGNPEDAQQIQNAIQFCALRAIFETADNDGQSSLKNGEWTNDVRFCAWSGVNCDGSGRVASLSLTFPGVPATLPNEIGAMTGLQTLHVIGNSAIPAGSLPTSFNSLTSLATLHLESTAITSLPDNLFSSLSKITTLELVQNAQMGNNLPSSLTGIPLQNLVVNGQALTNPLSTLSSSSSLQSSMKLIDLSSTSLIGTIPSSIQSLSSLVELHLDSNNLSSPLPTSFPSQLASLSMSNNTGLAGQVSGSFCSLGKLQNCDMRGTALSAAGGCGVCEFS